MQKEGLRKPTSLEVQTFESTKKEALRIIKIDFWMWPQSIVDKKQEGYLQETDIREIHKKIENINPLVCFGVKCGGCQADKADGCFHLKKRGSLSGYKILIKETAFKENKVSSVLVESLSELLVEQLLPNLGLSERRKLSKKAIDRFEKSKNMIQSTLASCPGPYSTNQIQFLIDNRHIIKPNSAWHECGQNYLKSEKQSGEPLRANPVARALLCRTNDKEPIFTLAKNQKLLLLLDHSCSGSSAVFLKK